MGSGWAGAGLGVGTNLRVLGLLVVTGLCMVTCGTGFLVYWYLGFGVVLASAQKPTVSASRTTTAVDR